MKNVGIIAEFNPFHLGHQHLIDSVKTDDTAVICVMSGNFVQRGDTALFPKEYRAKAALASGVDLIIDLPIPWAMSTAQNFAFGGVSLLKNTGIINNIAFGSESGDLSLINKTADILSSDNFNAKLRENLSTSNTFAKIRNDLMGEFSHDCFNILKNPNDTLITEYILAARRLNFNCNYEIIKRIGASHDSSEKDITVSATYLRELVYKGKFNEIPQYMPTPAFEKICNSPISDISKLETAILAVLRQKLDDNSLKNLTDISEGFENRFVKAVINATCLDDLYELLKTKRYTLARIRRIVLSYFIGIDNSYFMKEPPYIRILGFSKKGENLLKEIKKTSQIPVITNISDINNLDTFGLKVWEIENVATNLYSLSLNQPQRCGKEYLHKIIKGDL